MCDEAYPLCIMRVQEAIIQNKLFLDEKISIITNYFKKELAYLYKCISFNTELRDDLS